VRDVEKTAAFMESVLGWGPFAIVELELKEFLFRGQKGSCVIKVGLGNSGQMEIELIEVLRGDEANPYSDFLREHGEGMHHVRLDNPMEGGESLEDQLAVFATKGVKPLYELTMNWDEWEIDAAYVDAREQCGLIIEVSGPPRLRDTISD
jgi:hypothetical protein